VVVAGTAGLNERLTGNAQLTSSHHYHILRSEAGHDLRERLQALVHLPVGANQQPAKLLVIEILSRSPFDERYGFAKLLSPFR